MVLSGPGSKTGCFLAREQHQDIPQSDDIKEDGASVTVRGSGATHTQGTLLNAGYLGLLL